MAGWAVEAYMRAPTAEGVHGKRAEGLPQPEGSAAARKRRVEARAAAAEAAWQVSYAEWMVATAEVEIVQPKTAEELPSWEEAQQGQETPAEARERRVRWRQEAAAHGGDEAEEAAEREGDALPGRAADAGARAGGASSGGEAEGRGVVEGGGAARGDVARLRRGRGEDGGWGGEWDGGRTGERSERGR